MRRLIKRAVPAALTMIAALNVHAQLYDYAKNHGVSVSVGAFGNYATTLTSQPVNVTYNTVTPTGITLTQTATNQTQSITSSAGFLTSLQFHPVPWAGVEFNYGFQHYSERYNYNLTGQTAAQVARIPTSSHEATGAYQFHPKHIPFQPFVNIGGGAIYFNPTGGQGNPQWRGTGLLETGFDIAMPHTQRHLALRLEGRGLFYRAPNYSFTGISTRSWRASAEPSASFVYSF